MASPLFLLAPPRSYTSLMNAMLGQHPQAFGLPELCLFNVETLGQLWIRTSDEMGSDAKTRHGLLRAVAEIYAGEQTMHSVRRPNMFAARQNPACIVLPGAVAGSSAGGMEKRPRHRRREAMRAMYNAFPDARFCT